MKQKYIIGSVIILAFLIWAGISFKQTLTPYVSISEAKKSQTIVQVKGKLHGESEFVVDENQLLFTIVDNTMEEMDVVYNGVKPANFEHATDLVCIGRYENGKFLSNKLLLKCPSKYTEDTSQVNN